MKRETLNFLKLGATYISDLTLCHKQEKNHTENNASVPLLVIFIDVFLIYMYRPHNNHVRLDNVQRVITYKACLII